MAQKATPSSSASKKKKCTHCKNEYVSRSQLISHKILKHGMSVPEEYKDTQCFLCKKVYSNKTDLNKHHKAMHTEVSQKNFQCDYCNTKFVRRDNMYKHIRKFHPGEDLPTTKYYPCRRCGKHFFSRANRIEHERIGHRRKQTEKEIFGPHPFKKPRDTNKNRKRKVVSVFEEEFNKRHVKSNTNNTRGEIPRPFSCPHCDEQFTRQSTVRVHILRRHNQEKRRMPEKSKVFDEVRVLWLDQCLNNEALDTLYTMTEEPSWELNQRFKMEQATINFRITRRAVEICDMGYSYEVIRCILWRICRRFFGGSSDGRFQIQLDSEALDFPILTSVSDDLDFVLISILDQVYKTLGSKDRFMIDDLLQIRIVYVSPDGKIFPNDINKQFLIGSSRTLFSHCDGLDQYCQLLRSCWNPTTTDFGCLGSVIAAGILIAKDPKCKREKWFKDEYGANKKFQKIVDSLYQQADIDRTKPQQHTDLVKFQIVLNDISKEEWGSGVYRLVAYSSPDAKDVVFMGRPFVSDQKYRINLAVSKNHAYLITSLATFLDKWICRECSFSCDQRTCDQHRCGKLCTDCESVQCYEDQKRNPASVYDPRACEDCNRIFFSPFCFREHKRNLVCERFYQCLSCHKVVPYCEAPPDDGHNCRSNVKCKHCKEEFSIQVINGDEQHLCSLKRPNLDPIGTPEQFYLIAYDYETIVKKVTIDEGGGENPQERLKHHPYLASAVIFCEKCFWEQDEWVENCPTKGCGKKKRLWYNDPVEFARWLLFDPERRKKVRTVVVSHNGRRFDHFFPLSYLLQIGQKPQLLSNGNPILTMRLGQVIFKDFLAFCPQKLAKLSESFGFSEKISKGHFPWRYANESNLFKLPRPNLPDLYYYAPDLLKTEKEERELCEWYKENKNTVFHLKTEAERYAMGDSEILAHAIQRYTTLALEISGGKVNPVLSKHCITLASFVSLVYKTCFMPNEDCIGVIPTNGYHPGRKQSSFAAIYMDWLNEKRIEKKFPLIRHKFNHPAGEKKLGCYSLDRWVKSTGEAYQIHGCFYHAHSRCSFSGDPDRWTKKQWTPWDSSGNRLHPLFKLPYKAVEGRTMLQDFQLKHHPSIRKLRIKWQCDINKELSRKPLFQKFWESRSKLQPYWRTNDIRQALYGGITESFSLSCQLTDEQIAQGWEMRPMDVVSMYPTMQFEKEFPGCSHPEYFNATQLINQGKDWGIEEFQRYSPGVANVFVLPPNRVYYPVIPCRMHDHTMFLLCYACGRKKNQTGKCTHKNPTKKGLIGMYIIADLLKALEKGYEVIQVFEVFTYRAKPPTTELFAPMIRHLIKRKTESTGWPEEAASAEDKLVLLEYWKRVYNIDIDPELMVPNISMYSLIKLFLVAFWGKFAERPRQTRREYVRTWPQLRSILFTSQYEVRDLFFENDVALVTYEVLPEDRSETSMHNVVIGAHVTAYARHTLMGYMDQVWGRVLSCDTDGFIYLYKPNLPEPDNQGPALGQLKNELSQDCFIRRFQSLGPKNYRTEVINRTTGKVSVNWKAKGIMRTNAIHRALDSDTYQALIEHRVDHLNSFYQNLASEKDAEKSMALKKAFHLARVVAEVEAETDTTSVLFIPNPSIRKDLKRAEVFNDDEGVKIMKLTAVKRIYPPSVASAQFTSLPYGWKPLSDDDDDGQSSRRNKRWRVQRRWIYEEEMRLDDDSSISKKGKREKTPEKIPVVKVKKQVSPPREVSDSSDDDDGSGDEYVSGNPSSDVDADGGPDTDSDSDSDWVEDRDHKEGHDDHDDDNEDEDESDDEGNEDDEEQMEEVQDEKENDDDDEPENVEPDITIVEEFDPNKKMKDQLQKSMTIHKSTTLEKERATALQSHAEGGQKSNEKDKKVPDTAHAEERQQSDATKDNGPMQKSVPTHKSTVEKFNQNKEMKKQSQRSVATHKSTKLEKECIATLQSHFEQKSNEKDKKVPGDTVHAEERQKSRKRKEHHLIEEFEHPPKKERSMGSSTNTVSKKASTIIFGTTANDVHVVLDLSQPLPAGVYNYFPLGDGLYIAVDPCPTSRPDSGYIGSKIRLGYYDNGKISDYVRKRYTSAWKNAFDVPGEGGEEDIKEGVPGELRGWKILDSHVFFTIKSFENLLETAPKIRLMIDKVKQMNRENPNGPYGRMEFESEEDSPLEGCCPLGGMDRKTPRYVWAWIPRGQTDLGRLEIHIRPAIPGHPHKAKRGISGAVKMGEGAWKALVRAGDTVLSHAKEILENLMKSMVYTQSTPPNSTSRNSVLSPNSPPFFPHFS